MCNNKHVHDHKKEQAPYSWDTNPPEWKGSPGACSLHLFANYTNLSFTKSSRCTLNSKLKLSFSTEKLEQARQSQRKQNSREHRSSSILIYRNQTVTLQLHIGVLCYKHSIYIVLTTLRRRNSPCKGVNYH